MSISKITNLELNIGKSFTTDKGTFYPFRVTLADGTEGIANSTSPTPKWQIGQDVGYTAEQGKYGLKIKLTKPEQGFYGAPKRTEQISLTQPFDDDVKANSVKAAKFNSVAIERNMVWKQSVEGIFQNYRITNTPIDNSVVGGEVNALYEVLIASHATSMALDPQ